LEKAKRLVLYHHERYDGKGYPEGLAGQEIPIGARLLAIADAFDTMTTDRSYRATPGIDYALSELYRCSGTQFCPVAVEAFVSRLKTQKGLIQPNLEALPINKNLELSLMKLSIAGPVRLSQLR
jgi:HD-GYP domain-containing protein (c-di-GMP phosphodiesterase class II)